MTKPMAVVLLVVTLPTAVAAHEATHYIVARAFGIQAWVSSATSISYRIEPGRPDWQYRLVGAAPQLIGWAIGVGWYLTHGLPWSPLGIVAMGTWAIYSLGSLEDISLAMAKGHEPPWRRWWRRLDEEAQAWSMLSVLAILAATMGMLGLRLRSTLSLGLIPASIGLTLGTCVLGISRFRP